MSATPNRTSYTQASLSPSILHPILNLRHLNCSPSANDRLNPCKSFECSKLYCNNQLSIFCDDASHQQNDPHSSLNHRLLQPAMVIPINTCIRIDRSVVKDGLTVRDKRQSYISIKQLHIKSTHSP